MWYVSNDNHVPFPFLATHAGIHVCFSKRPCYKTLHRPQYLVHVFPHIKYIIFAIFWFVRFFLKYSENYFSGWSDDVLDGSASPSSNHVRTRHSCAGLMSAGCCTIVNKVSRIGKCTKCTSRTNQRYQPVWVCVQWLSATTETSSESTGRITSLESVTSMRARTTWKETRDTLCLKPNSARCFTHFSHVHSYDLQGFAKMHAWCHYPSCTYSTFGLDAFRVKIPENLYTR